MQYPQFKVVVQCATFNHAKYITDAMNGFTMQQTDFPFIERQTIKVLCGVRLMHFWGGCDVSIGISVLLSSEEYGLIDSR